MRKPDRQEGRSVNLTLKPLCEIRPAGAKVWDLDLTLLKGKKERDSLTPKAAD
jgi:hypothetical protein